MLDLLLVLPDRKLAPTEKNIVGTEPEWDVFEPVTRTAAQFHGANHRRFPHHYPRKIRNMDFMEMAKLQRKPDCPVLYLPLLQVPRAGVRRFHSSFGYFHLLRINRVIFGVSMELSRSRI